MKIEIIKENLKKQICKFIIDDNVLLTKKLPILIELNVPDKGHLSTSIKLFPGTKQEFSFVLCDDNGCCGYCSDFPDDESFLQENVDFADEIITIIRNEIEFFQLKCEIFDNRKRLIPWIKDNLIKNQS